MAANTILYISCPPFRCCGIAHAGKRGKDDRLLNLARLSKDSLKGKKIMLDSQSNLEKMERM
jgi:hypothetical protein